MLMILFDQDETNRSLRICMYRAITTSSMPTSRSFASSSFS